MGATIPSDLSLPAGKKVQFAKKGPPSILPIVGSLERVDPAAAF